tara:strand:- start:70 stop:369 length:300 start_codon:yes stop_codon:yes gene_type:complete
MITYAEAVIELVGTDNFIGGPTDGPIGKINLVEGTTPPTDKQINDKIAELKAEYDAKKYQRDRAEAYDPIPEQLDQIYHDMDGWKAKIKAVKDKYPKPK